MTFRNLETADLSGKRALVRVDFNVPMEDGRITDDTRLVSALPTIRFLSQAGARVVLLAHFDRPKGRRVPEMSLNPVVEPLAALLGAPVAFADDCIGPEAVTVIEALPAGGVCLLENLRYHAGEEANDPAFVESLAANGDLFVNDAFSAAHRAHASTEGLARRLPAYPGLSMRRELDALSIVCKAAGFDRSLYLTFAVLILDRDGNAMGRAREYGELYEALPREAAQRTIRFWRMRRQSGDVAAA
jgi:phosphoglycerate kinase